MNIIVSEEISNISNAPPNVKKASVIPGASKFMLLCLLSQSLEMSNVRTKCLKECILVVVPHTKLLARFTYNGSYFWIVNLTHAWEQVVSSLMVQSTWEMGKNHCQQQLNSHHQDFNQYLLLSNKTRRSSTCTCRSAIFSSRFFAML